jgi:hypothetical protein
MSISAQEHFIRVHYLTNGGFWVWSPFRLWHKAGWKPMKAGSCGWREDWPTLAQDHGLGTSNLHLGDLVLSARIICIRILAYSFDPAFSGSVTDTVFTVFTLCWGSFTCSIGICSFYNLRPLWITYRNFITSLMRLSFNREPGNRAFFLVSYLAISIQIGYVYILVAAFPERWERVIKLEHQRIVNRMRLNEIIQAKLMAQS